MTVTTIEGRAIKSNPNVRIHNGLHVIRCLNCDSEFERPVMRGIKPFYGPCCSDTGRTVRTVPTQTAETETTTDDAAPMRHKNYGQLLALAGARVPVMLVGGAGSGKTTAARQVANDLGLSVITESCNPDMSATAATGYMSANGTYVPGFLHGVVKHGGVLLLDEFDSAPGDVVTVLNAVAASVAGDPITFPNGETVEIHSDFILIAGANTFGRGSFGGYKRQTLDAATLDRFATLEWEVDETLELAFAENRDWTLKVQTIRGIVKANGLDMLITPRASINGAKALKAGLTMEEVMSLFIFKGASEDDRRTIELSLNA